jgi:type I restriction enzyme S subunit
MVTSNLAYNYSEYYEQEQDYTYLPDELKHTSVSLQEVRENKSRLEASAFNLEAKLAKEKILANKYSYVNLWSENGLVKNAYYPGRFKRIYVSKDEGNPFYLPSQLTEINPKPTKYISSKTYNAIDGIEIMPNNLLMTRSGTIGKCSISSKANIGKIYSDDVIRVSFKGEFDLGYIYAFLQTEIGQQILQINNYGAVIQHIEPEHLQTVIIPNAPELLKKEIHELIIASYDLRDQSNDLLDCAEKILYQELQLKPIEELAIKYFDNLVDLRNYTTNLNDLNLRLDCSYHLPEKQLAKKALKKHSLKNIKIGDNNISKSIYTGNRFKRIYVDKSHGVPYLTGKQIMELNPGRFEKKYLSADQHAAQIEEQLLIEPNTILITCSGSVGKVVLVPEHWRKWVGTHDMIRLIPKDNDIAGYLFCFLNSGYGQHILNSLVYGAVVDHIEAFHVANIEIPILKNQSKQQEINELVLRANELRYQAYLKEQDAIEKMERIIEKRDFPHPND